MTKDEKIKSILNFNLVENRNGKFYSFGLRAENHLDLLRSPGIITFLKERFKRWPKIYYFLIWLFSPVFYNRSLVKTKAKQASQDKVVVNLGSGNSFLSAEIINTDICDYPAVDVIASAHALPFRDQSLDLMMSECMIEHLPDPEKFLREAKRVIKNGGELLLTLPFIFPYHGSPHDYTRWTYQGIESMCLRHGFKTKKLKVASGPASALTGVLIWILSMILSFGSRVLYEIWYIFFSLILWPIKFLDLIMIFLPMSKELAANYIILCVKEN